MHTRMTVATLIAVAAALLTACSSNDDSSADADFNAADVTFATDMIPHHRQATEMSALAASRTENPQVLDLADRIEAAQDPEIDTMSTWLKTWGKKVPGDMKSMDSMPGMMSDDQMSQLRDSSGETFDRMFLSMMVEHHEGAIEMAKTEQTDGKYADAKSLATTIEQAQTAEVTEMKGLLAS